MFRGYQWIILNWDYFDSKTEFWIENFTIALLVSGLFSSFLISSFKTRFEFKRIENCLIFCLNAILFWFYDVTIIHEREFSWSLLQQQLHHHCRRHGHRCRFLGMLSPSKPKNEPTNHHSLCLIQLLMFGLQRMTSYYVFLQTKRKSLQPPRGRLIFAGVPFVAMSSPCDFVCN